MSNTEQIADLVSECLDHCRMSGFTLATLVYFLDELRGKGHSEVDVQWVDEIMRRVLKGVLVPDDAVGEISESPTSTYGGKTTKVIDS
jgi:hypothetical protein